MTIIDLFTPLSQRPNNVSTSPAARGSEPGQTVATGTSRADALPGDPAVAGGGLPRPARDLEGAVIQLNDLIQNIRRELQFSIDESSGKTVITVIDVETRQVVRQIPPQEVTSIIQGLEAHTAGLTAGVAV